MAIFRIQKNENYTIMSNYHFRDMTITLKAKGLLSQMLSLPEGWNYTLTGLASINREGIDAIREAVKELERAGYVVRRRVRDEKGVFTDMEYMVYEIPYNGMKPPEGTANEPTLENPTPGGNTGCNPTSGNPTLENPILENPTLENPLLENPMQSNKDILNKDGLNKDILKSSSKSPHTDAGEDDDDFDNKFSRKIKLEEVRHSLDSPECDSLELVDMVYGELKERGREFCERVDARMFASICEKVTRYSSTISARSPYINKCIDNVMLSAMRNPKPKTGRFGDMGLRQEYDLDSLERDILAN
jgi:hypothetical protein